MSQSDRRWSWQLGLASGLVLGGAIFAFFGGCALAQLKPIPDGTLGKENSVVTPINSQVDRIDGGAQRGANLFHSFREFNIDEGRGVYFTNPTGIENILSRVTGANRSIILGKLGVLGNANLFLINPKGIIFGPNASLDVRGSFVASTANRFIFPDGNQFSATNPEAPPLLTINVPIPIGLEFEGDEPGTIVNAGNLVAGKDLTLAAGNLDLQGQLYTGRNLTLQAQDTVKVRDSVFTPFIAVAGGQLVVQGNRGIDIFTLNHPQSGLFSGGDMVLRSTNPVGGDAHYWSGGSFRIEKLDGNLGDLFSLYDPIIRSQGDVSFFGYQGTSLHILAGGSVTIDTVNIIGPDTVGDTINPTATPTLANVTLSDGTSLVIDGSTRPTLDVRAGMKPEAIGTPLGTSGVNFPNDLFFDSSFFLVPPPENNPVATSASININRIFNSGGVVFLTNQYQPNPALSGGITVGLIDTSSDLGGGSVALDSRGETIVNDSLNVSGGDLSTLNFPSDGGDVTLLANGDITLNPGAFIASVGLLGGNIILKSDANISITNSAIVSVSFSPVAGTTGGDINVMARSLSVRDGAGITASTLGEGNTGDLTVTAQSVELVGTSADGRASSLSTQVVPGARGSGGNLRIDTGSLLVRDGAGVLASTLGEGDAGDLTVTAQSVELVGTSANGQLTSGLSTQVQPGARGNGGNLRIDTGSLLVRDGAQVLASTLSEGDAGDLTVTAQSVELVGTSANGRFTSGLSTQVQPGARGSGGNLRIDTGSLLVRDGAVVTASTLSEGDAGDLTVTAQSVELVGRAASGRGSRLSTQVQPGARGSGGNLGIDTGSLLVRDGAQVSASTFGEGDAGDLTVTARLVEVVGGSADGQGISGLSTQVGPEGRGSGGNLRIDTGSLLVRDGAQVSTSTSSEGNAGDLTVTAQLVELVGTTANGQAPSGLSASVEPGARGSGGNLRIDTGSLLVRDGARVSASTLGEGKAGDLTVTAQSVELVGTTANGQAPSGLSASVEPGARGSGGNLRIDTGSLLVRDGAQVSASTLGEGDAGDLTVTAQSVELVGESAYGQFSSGLFTQVQPGARGSGGNLRIGTGSLLVRDGARVSASTLGEGDAGDLTVTAQSVELVGTSANGQSTSGLFALVAPGATGDGGDLIVTASESVTIRDDGQLSVETRGTGNAGNLSINTQQLTIENRAQATVSSTGSGTAGNLEVNARDVRLNNQAKLAAETDSGEGGNIALNDLNTLEVNNSNISASTMDGRAGSLSVNARESVQLNGKGGLAVEATGSGSAGSLTVDTPQLTLNNGAEISASTVSGEGGDIKLENLENLEVTNSLISASTASGRAGDVTIKATESVQLSGEGGLSVEATEGGTAGSLSVETENLTIQDGARISVSSLQGQAGNIGITANSLLMDRGLIAAETGVGTEEGGANINLTVPDSWLMSNESLISATAFGNANGGNITINTRFLVVLPPEGTKGSDIIANAVFGNGGQVNINAVGLFGIEFRANLTPFNDITASSQFGSQGVVSINTAGIDPTRGLDNLPETTVAPQIDQGCSASGGQASVAFFDIGRGGSPPSPDELLSPDLLMTSDLVPFEFEEKNEMVLAPQVFTTATQLRLPCGVKKEEQGLKF